MQSYSVGRRRRTRSGLKSSKAMRSAMLLGALMIFSIAVNAIIVVMAGGGGM